MIEIDCIDFKRIGFNKLWIDYQASNPQLLSHFDYEAFNESDLRKKVTDLDLSKYDRKQLVKVLSDYNQRFTSDKKVFKQIKRLENPNSLSITTGQQLGVLGGPLFTLFKALSCVIAAKKAQQVLNVDVIPVFWMADEDHDFHEIRSVNVLNEFEEIQKLKIHEDHTNFTVADIQVHRQINLLLEELSEIFRYDENALASIQQIKSYYQPGKTHLEAFGALMTNILSSFGMVLAGSNDQGIKYLLKEPFRTAIQNAKPLQEVLEKQSDELEKDGYNRQVKITSSQLFLLDSEYGRLKLEHLGNGVWSDEKKRHYTDTELLERVETNAENFSPNVFLRPILQDVLLPNIAYIAGPGELSYYAQTKAFYSKFGLKMPIIYPRISATVVGKATRRKIEQLGWPIEDYAERIEQLEKRFSLENLTSLQKLDFDSIEEKLNAQLSIIKTKALYDSKEMEVVFNRFDKVLKKEFNWLYDKYINKVKKNNSISIKRLHQVKSNTFPDGNLQERYISLIQILLQFGPIICQELLNEFEKQVSWNHHFLVSIPKAEVLNLGS